MPRSMHECHELGQHAAHPRRRCPDCAAPAPASTAVGDVVRFELRGSMRSGRVMEVFESAGVEFCWVLSSLPPGGVERLRIATARILRFLPC